MGGSREGKKFSRPKLIMRNAEVVNRQGVLHRVTDCFRAEHRKSKGCPGMAGEGLGCDDGISAGIYGVDRQIAAGLKGASAPGKALAMPSGVA